MTNMIQNAKDQAAALAMAAYKAAAADGTLPEAEVKTAPVEIPKDTANGDYTTTFALAAAKALGKPPRVIAQALLDHMDLAGTYFTSAEIAGPGFLNFRLGDQWYAGVMNAVETEKDVYGTNDSLKGQKIMVEFVSANPTGPMHMGNARGGVLGDTLASVLAACGADVSREFYVNDAGHQIDKFARSIEVRYLQLINGEDSIAFPEDGYQGEDIKELAKAYYDEHGDSLLNASEQKRQDALAQFGLSVNLPRIKTDLERYKIHYDTWFYESTLHESGYVAETVDLLTEKGWTYEKDGALWLKTADILRDHFRKQGKKEADIEKLDLKDDVLRRANGFYTYFAADIAYHRNKFAVRGFDKVINIWGADHHGHVARLKGALDALGLNGSDAHGVHYSISGGKSVVLGGVVGHVHGDGELVAAHIGDHDNAHGGNAPHRQHQQADSQPQGQGLDFQAEAQGFLVAVQQLVKQRVLDLFLGAQYGGTRAGHHGQRHDQRGQQAEGDSQCHIGEQFAHHAGGEDHRQKYADGGQGRGDDGTRNLPGALNRSSRGRYAAPAQTVDVLDDNDRVIHQHADAQRQARQTEDIEGDAGEIHHHDGKQHAQRHRDGDDQRWAQVL